jgi:hypothetical protein
MLFTDIREVLGSNFGRDGEYSGFRGFSQSLRAISGTILQFGPRSLTSISFQSIIH